MKWVTRERPKIDRIACPWLIQRFIDPQAEFLYVPANQVLAVAQSKGATPYDIPGVEMSHVGELCSLDPFLHKYDLSDPALQQLATIVRGADTDRLDLTPQSAGLYALSLGLSRQFANDHEMLRHGMVMYDALYAWCQSCQGETHSWPPKMASTAGISPEARNKAAGKRVPSWRPRLSRPPCTSPRCLKAHSVHRACLAGCNPPATELLQAHLFSPRANRKTPYKK